MTSKYSMLAPNILFVEVTDPFTAAEDTVGLQKEIVKTKPQVEGTLYVVSDLRNAKISFSDLMMGMAQSVNDEAGYKAGDTGVQPIIVANDELLLQLENFYKQEQYGSAYLPTFSSLEDGMAFIKKQEDIA